MGLPVNHVVQAFLAAKERGHDVICRTCPRCRKYLVDLDAAVEPTKQHTCGHCAAVVPESFAAVCSPLAEFGAIAKGGKLLLTSRDFV